jgi:hypothetical protein
MPRDTEHETFTTTTSGGTLPEDTIVLATLPEHTLPPQEPRGHADLDLDALARAVYLHIQAVRAMGRETVNTVEIAKALNVSVSTIERVIPLLKTKGVKVAA